MKITHVGAVAFSAAVLVSGVTGCSSFDAKSGTTKAADATPSTSASAESSSSEAPETSSPGSSMSSSSESDSSSSDLVQGKVGQEVKSSTLSVKVNKIVDPVKSSNEYMTPQSGNRFVAIDMTVKNLGDKSMNFSDFMCINVKTTSDRDANKTYMSDYGTQFSNRPLQKGDSATGDYNIEVPQGEKVKTIDVKCLTASIDSNEPTLRVNADSK